MSLDERQKLSHAAVVSPRQPRGKVRSMERDQDLIPTSTEPAISPNAPTKIQSTLNASFGLTSSVARDFKREIGVEAPVRGLSEASIRESSEAPVLRKSLAIEDLELAGRTDLLFLWENVMADYVDRSRHEAFVNACLQADALTFAAKKYAQILEAAPTEEIANDMRRRIRGFAGVHLDGASPDIQIETWALPLPSFNSFIVFLGSILVVMGLGLPRMMDVAKLGFSMILIALGLRIFLRRPN